MEKRDTRRPNLALLHPEALARLCVRSHLRPSPGLAPYVSICWTMQWDIPTGESYAQQVLPNPCVQIIVTSQGVEVLGVVTSAFTALLEGDHFVLGVKFRPGGFYPFTRRPVAELTDRRVPLNSLFPEAPVGAIQQQAANRDSRAIIDLIEPILHSRLTQPDQAFESVTGAIELIASTPNLLTLEDLSRHSTLTVRTLQRLFQRYVGVSPKWVIRRYRLQEAAARIEAGETEDWAGLALKLGYFDQSHFIREFRAMAGQPPGAYGRGQPVVHPQRRAASEA